MIDSSTKSDIEKISYEILKQSNSFDIFPTPVDLILNYSNFVIDNSLDLTSLEPFFFESFTEKSKKVLLSAFSKVKGMFDRQEKTIYIDSNLDKNLGKKNFVKLHEIGHGVLPWQNEFMFAIDNNITLCEEYQEQFEEEANYFASITLFQHDRFLSEIEKYDLSIGTIMFLSKMFGSSIHSAFRNYVLNSKNRCALLVLNPIENSGWNTPLCSTRDLFYSKNFLSEFGELNLPDKFGYRWSFIKDFKFRKINNNGSIILDMMNGEKLDASYQFFNNNYNSFVFIFPKGEKNKAKTKVILTS